VVVQNQTGGSGASGHEAGSRARPDGYTLTMGTFELSTMRIMGISQLTYRDFQPLAQVNGDAAAILVRPAAPWKSLRELLNDARQRPDQIKMSGTAAGGAWDLARVGLLLADNQPAANIRWVPSQGSAPALVDLLGGHVDAVCCSLPEAASQVDAGQLRVLGVMAAQRVPSYPQVPTAREDGLDFEAVGWRGLLLPKGTPEDVRQRLTAAIRKVLEAPEFGNYMAQNGFAIQIREGGEFERFLAAQEERWRTVIDAAGFASPGADTDPGPCFFPALLGTCLIAGTAGLIGKALLQKLSAPQSPEGPSERTTRPREWLAFWTDRGKSDVLLLLVSLPVYLLAMPWLGFFASTFIWSVLVMRRLGQRWEAAIPIALLLLSAIYVLFVYMFRVQLPLSPWGPPL
jgi:tripartite-type tricarboxylate transporter receptor subunit TctC